MEPCKSLEVYMGSSRVGTLALYRERLAAFEYADEWLRDGFSINPLKLPLQKHVFMPKIEPFDGLFGAFADSLPDGWGRLLVDRMLLREHEEPNTIGVLSRLAIVGDSGMGALSYRPVHTWKTVQTQLAYDRYAEECRRILETEYSADLDELFFLGGSSGGARPKIMTTVDGEDWIIKFPASTDRRDIGLTEYQYSLCAKKCGIEMSETRLFPSEQCEGYFGTKRFERIKEADGSVRRVHMLSVSALLEVSHRIPSLDYHSLVKLTLELTKDYSEVEKMYRLMCFNVFAHNRDDHSKNFSFLYDRSRGWHLSPAYDLTYSNSVGGEHATCVNGNGRNPQLADILAVADKVGIAKGSAKRIAEQVRDTVAAELGDVKRFR